LLSSAVFTGREYDARSTAKQVMDVVLNGIGCGGKNRQHLNTDKTDKTD
jgi:hypothetical protein